MKIALITGINGQDGSYLSELLLSKHYIVYGMIRRSSSINTSRIDHIFDKLIIRYGDLSDSNSIQNILREIQLQSPDILEVYNLAAMSHVKVSFEMPEYTGNIDGLGTLRVLESLRTCGIPLNRIKFYQASTSELYGKVLETPQNEQTPFNPVSPYAVSKLYGYYITKNYRESYNMFACSGILFNHESPRRGETFVTRKISRAVANISRGTQDVLRIGNIKSYRDWGHAKDFVYGMWLILQQETPQDIVLSTDETHSVKEFIDKAFGLKNIHLTWIFDENGNEKCAVDQEEITRVIIDPKYYRPVEVDLLLGDSRKARTLLGWKPQVSFSELVQEMVDYDVTHI